MTIIVFENAEDDALSLGDIGVGCHFISTSIAHDAFMKIEGDGANGVDHDVTAISLISGETYMFNMSLPIKKIVQTTFRLRGEV